MINCELALDGEYAAFVVTTLLSMLCCFALSVLYFTDRELKKPPGSLVATYFLVSSLLYLLVILFSFSPIGDGASACYVSSCLFMYMLLSFAAYNSAINIELLLKIRHPCGENFVIPQLYYHLYSIFVSLIGILILTLFNYKPWYNGMCHVRRVPRTAAGLSAVMFFMIFLILLTGGTVIFYLYKLKNFVRHSFIHVSWLSFCSCFVLSLFFVLPYLSGNECTYAEFELFTTCSGGLLTFIIRFIDKDFRTKLTARICKRSKINYSRELQISTLSLAQDCDEDRMSFLHGGLYKCLTGKFILDSLIALKIYHEQQSVGNTLVEGNDSISVTGTFDDKSISMSVSDIDSAMSDSRMFELANEYKGICLKIVEYYPAHFREIRAMEGVTDQMLVRSFNPKFNLKKLSGITEKKGGGSGAFIYNTHDQLYYVKTITPYEKHVFLETILPHYKERIATNDTLLARILGVYMVQVLGNYCTNILVMESASFSSIHTFMKFDLKGSSLNRRVLKDNSVRSLYNSLLKDQDFSSMIGRLKLEPSSREDFLRRVHLDVKMLHDCKIMDYSLLITVGSNIATDPGLKYLYKPEDCTNTSFSIAIIDFTQRYTWDKVAENVCKQLLSLANYNEISSVDIETYARRFIDMCNRIA